MARDMAGQKKIPTMATRSIHDNHDLYYRM